MAKTKIIAIEGIDGSGKSVQFERLRFLLISLGYSVAVRSYPMYDSFFGSQVGNLLSGNDAIDAVNVDGKSMALWFALDRWDSFKGYTNGESDFLLINRYVLSNAVYQNIRDCDVGKPDISDWIFDLEYNRFALPRPDVTLLFDVSEASASENVDKKGFREYVGDKKDVYEASVGIQQRARRMYIKIAQKYDDIAVIDCMTNGRLRGIDEIADMVKNELLRRGIIKLL